MSPSALSCVLGRRVIVIAGTKSSTKDVRPASAPIGARIRWGSIELSLLCESQCEPNQRVCHGPRMRATQLGTIAVDDGEAKSQLVIARLNWCSTITWVARIRGP